MTAIVEHAIGTRSGSATICLTGGRTPERLYQLLADPARPWRARIDWPLVHLFWSDERHVPPDHPDSNYGMAARALIDHVPIPPDQVHRMRGELPDARDAARAYEAELREGFARARRQDQTFDVLLLGLGEDAHIASIFPGSPLLDETSASRPQPRGCGLGAAPERLAHHADAAGPARRARDRDARCPERRRPRPSTPRSSCRRTSDAGPCTCCGTLTIAWSGLSMPPQPGGSPQARRAVASGSSRKDVRR